MALIDNKRLYDIATRQQVYVEGVKVWQAHEFDLFLRELSEELRKLLPRIKFKTLDALTKAQLTSFIIELRKTQSRLYSLYLDRLLGQLEDFMKVSLVVTKRVFTSAFIEDDDAPLTVLDEDDANEVLEDSNTAPQLLFLFGVAAITANPSALWARIGKAPIPANGVYLPSFLKGFTNSAQAAVENAVRKAYANGETLEELTGSLLDRSVQGTAGVLQRLERQGAAAIATSMQHIAEVVSASITSGLFGRYRWYSVIDSATTDICISRNHQIYTYGEGPLPPAHINCRSHIGPVRGSDDPPEENFNQWQTRQPEEFRKDVSADNKFSAKSIAPNQYQNKVDLILSR